MRRAWGRGLVAVGAVLMLAAGAASQGSKPLGALAQLQPGLWQLRQIGQTAAPARSICIANADVLVQLEHPRAPCSRVVVANHQNSATVHYTCPTNGYGRTAIRVESSRLALVDTQGIRDNLPFAYRAEARRLGPCSGGAR